MSANFTGVTFPNQKVTPANDAVIRRAIFDDGILTGCDLSYSGSTLTMTAGQLMICGRQIIHPSSQNWAVTEATSGYARLVLTIDVTRTSTKDTFDQVVDEIQYATDANGFADLTTADINATGTRYQVAVCVVSLGPGGITGIASKLGQAGRQGYGAGRKTRKALGHSCGKADLGGRGRSCRLFPGSNRAGLSDIFCILGVHHE